MATGGLYGSSGTGALIATPGSESSGLYGNSTSFGGTYFEWFIFQTSETQPATPTGGTWNFTTNTNTPPTGWSSAPPSNPLNTVWVSIAIVNSRNTAPLVWSVPGKFAFSSGLPILSDNGAPEPADGQSDQLYIQLDTAPQTIWFKESGTWTRLTGSTLYADLTSNQTIAGTKTFSSQIQGSISGNAANVTGTVAITNGGTGSTTAGSARTALGAASSGANNDITSLSGLTTALSLTHGGTGATTAPNARTNLGLGSAAVLTAGAANGVATLDAGGTVPLSQIPASIQGGVSYQGTWNATTNTPTLTSSVGSKGYYYVVSVAGSTNLNGITSWNIGDWAIYNGTAWEKIDNTDAVTSVNGYTGTVVLTQPDIAGTASLTTTQTLTNKTLTSPVINEILDANNNEILSLSPVASATDYLTVRNGIGVGVPLHIQADGPSANIGLHIQPKGTGLVTINDGTDFNKGIRFRSSGSAAGAVTLIDAVSSAGHVITLPNANTTLVGRDTTDTLTNKTIDLANNTLSGTASININGTVGATTPNTGSFTTLTTSGAVTHNAGTANGVAYLNGSKVLTTGSALTFDGTTLTSTGGSLYLNGTNSDTAMAGSYVRFGTNLGTQSNAANTALVTKAFNGSVFYDAYSIGNNNTWIWNYSGSEAMRLTSTGLGIGTSSPGTRLDVSGVIRGTFNSSSIGGATTHGFEFRNATTTTKALIGGYDSSTGAYIQAVNFGTAYENLVLQPNGGNLGLGVTPTGKAKFEVYTGAGAYAGISTRFNATNFPISFGVTNANGVPYFGVNARQVSGTDGQTYDIDGFASRMWCNGGGFSFFTAPSGTAGNAISFTQAMTLDASGNLGVGETSPATYAALAVKDKGGNGTIAAISATNVLYIKNSGTSASITYNDAYPLTFGTNNTERARIDSSGNLLVGTTTAVGSGTNTTASTTLAKTYNWFAVTDSMYVQRSNNTDGTVFQFFRGSSNAGNISITTSTTAYNTSSDYRLKNSIAPMTGALAKVALLKPCTYKWNADGSDGEGFIAHELAEVVPQCVTGEKDAVDADGKPQYQGIDTSFLVATLTAAIQELKASLDEVKLEFDAYKATHP